MSDRRSRLGLDEDFDKVYDPALRRLLPIIKGLMKLRPLERISASQALKLLEEPYQQAPEEMQHAKPKPVAQPKHVSQPKGQAQSHSQKEKAPGHKASPLRKTK